MHAARIGLEDSEPAAVGAAVTVALCGNWEHEGACRWPHHTACGEPTEGIAVCRTVFAVEAEDESVVRALIDGALREEPAWRVFESGARSPTAEERVHGKRIAGPALP